MLSSLLTHRRLTVSLLMVVDLGHMAPHKAQPPGRVSILPEIPEPRRTQLGVPDRVLDIPVTKVLLDRASIVALVRELISACVAQHMRMDGKGNPCRLSSTSDQLADRVGS